MAPTSMVSPRMATMATSSPAGTSQPFHVTP